MTKIDVTVDEVVNAYTETGLTPRTGLWWDYDERTPCACGMTALAMSAHKGRTLQDIGSLMEAEDPEIWEQLLGLDERYVYGFAVGFDGADIHADKHERWAEGYEVGKAVRDRLFDIDEEGEAVPKEEFR